MKIESYFDKKEKKTKYRTRFQIHGREFRLSADTKKELDGLIDEVRGQERRAKYKLPVTEDSPSLKELVEIHTPKIPKKHQRVIFERVSKNLLALLPKDIKIIDLKKAHFQKYIDWRARQKALHTRRPVLPETIDKELYAISSALAAASLYFPELEDYQKPKIPKASKGNKKRKRDKLVSKGGELDVLLAELRRPKTGKQTEYTEQHRRRLADDLEFRYETGLRRKEVARLKVKQYFPNEQALRQVKRWKTDTVTKFFPLSKRAKEIIENRLINKNGSEYIFTRDGEPVASDYRTLVNVCADLGINYGKYSEDGFVPHDLRHNFASEIIKNADIKTAQELLGHSNIEQTADYLHTDEKQLRDAMRRREGIDKTKDIIEIYKALKRGKMKAKEFLEKVKKLTEF